MSGNDALEKIEGKYKELLNAFKEYSKEENSDKDVLDVAEELIECKNSFDFARYRAEIKPKKLLTKG